MEALGLTTAAEFNRVFDEAKRAMESPRVHCVAPFYISYGQRPGSGPRPATRVRRTCGARAGDMADVDLRIGDTAAVVGLHLTGRQGRLCQFSTVMWTHAYVSGHAFLQCQSSCRWMSTEQYIKAPFLQLSWLPRSPPVGAVANLLAAGLHKIRMARGWRRPFWRQAFAALSSLRSALRPAERASSAPKERVARGALYPAHPASARWHLSHGPRLLLPANLELGPQAALQRAESVRDS